VEKRNPSSLIGSWTDQATNSDGCIFDFYLKRTSFRFRFDHQNPLDQLHQSVQQLKEDHPITTRRKENVPFD
jgi:hypothetical protein